MSARPVPAPKTKVYLYTLSGKIPKSGTVTFRFLFGDEGDRRELVIKNVRSDAVGRSNGLHFYNVMSNSFWELPNSGHDEIVDWFYSPNIRRIVFDAYGYQLPSANGV